LIRTWCQESVQSRPQLCIFLMLLHLYTQLNCSATEMFLFVKKCYMFFEEHTTQLYIFTICKHAYQRRKVLESSPLVEAARFWPTCLLISVLRTYVTGFTFSRGKYKATIMLIYYTSQSISVIFLVSASGVYFAVFSVILITPTAPAIIYTKYRLAVGVGPTILLRLSGWSIK